MTYWMIRVGGEGDYRYLDKAIPLPRFSDRRLDALTYEKKKTAEAYLDLARDVERASVLVRVTVTRKRRMA